MNKDLSTWLTETSPETFKMSVKVPQIDNVINDLTLFIDKILPLKNANKLGAIIIQLPPSFTIKEFRNLEEFLYVIKITLLPNLIIMQ